ncbi:phage recombination protein Bet [Streptomyces sp. NPDC050421]|uniref:phage recombination protein Bet n=1 Tax=Streptomyces sp. NPDC050421 TaxID=3365613 RepID=UPI00379391AF
MTEIAQAGGSLAIRPDQTVFSAEQAAVLRQSGIDNDVTGAELSGFLHLCQRTGLDPFSRQIYLIGRKDKRAGRKVFTPQTGIDGYRVIAHRVVAASREMFGYEDTVWCDSAGRWRDVWLAEDAPAAAKVTVLRNGQRFSAVAVYREYVQTDFNGSPTRMWKNMGANQIAKCAEALALRKAFPHDLAGVYTAEEMGQADNPAPEQAVFHRIVKGEPDQWATPPAVVAAGVADVPAESLTPGGRDYLHEAHAAPDAATVRLIWMDAQSEGAVKEYLAQIADVGKAKAAASAPEPAADEVVDGEIVTTPEDDYAAAVADLRDAAETARLDMDSFEVDAAKALGMALADAPTEAIRALAATIRPAA